MKSKVLGISLILISIFSYLMIELNIKYKKINHEKIIDSIILGGNYNETKYIGYIKIDGIGIKKGIINGINDEILNNDDVGMIKRNNIILAGHAVSNVFKNLSEISISDIIELFIYNEKNKYIVYDKIVVDKHDMSHLSSELVLITCVDDNNRLLVLAHKI